ncbi:MAG: N-acetyltransferase [Actinomycetota bacterium]
MFVPDGFQPPLGLRSEVFLLEPLGPQHNERDHAAWMSSIEHIHATPGFGDPLDPDPWPRPMTLAENLEDMLMHARHHHDREGFTYTVLDAATKDVIGCVYIYPLHGEDLTADVRSWVRSSHADLDAPLWRAVSEWLTSDWPFTDMRFAAR